MRGVDAHLASFEQPGMSCHAQGESSNCDQTSHFPNVAFVGTTLLHNYFGWTNAFGWSTN
jgi:hypothetical protein